MSRFHAPLSQGPLFHWTIGTEEGNILYGTQPFEILIGRDGDDGFGVEDNFSAVLGGRGDDTVFHNLNVGNIGDTPLWAAADFGGLGDDDMGTTMYGDATASMALVAYMSGGAGDDGLLWDSYVFGEVAALITSTTLTGGLGADLLFINSVSQNILGLDVILTTASGGQGDDTMSSGSIAESPGTGAVLRTHLDGGVGNDDISSRLYLFDEGPEIFALNDLRGGEGADDLNGRIWIETETDTLTARNILRGGAGQDDLVAEIVFTVDPGNGIAQSLLFGGAGNDTLTVIGGQDNRLNGGLGDDVITGGDGDDLLIGGTGNDVMTGGLGTDTFVLRPNRDDGSDWIEDFDPTTDRLLILGLDDTGAPGLVDDLDALATFNPSSTDVWITLDSGTVFRFWGAAFSDASSFADLVDDPATQILADWDALA